MTVLSRTPVKVVSDVHISVKQKRTKWEKGRIPEVQQRMHRVVLCNWCASKKALHCTNKLLIDGIA